MATSLPYPPADVQDYPRFASRMARVDGCPECVLNTELPKSTAPTTTGYRAAYLYVARNAGKTASSPQPEVMEAAAQLYASWSGRPSAVRLCRSCRRPWVPDADDQEPADDCWPCVHAWCDGLDYGKEVTR